MANLYRNGKYWYLNYRRKGYATGMRTSEFSMKKVRERIQARPDSDPLKSMLFDINPTHSKHQPLARLLVGEAFDVYAATVNGLGENGDVVDGRQHQNWVSSIHS